ncbi:hypothetical protein HQ560_00595 [bacterium]|nr:hypothetical protein [bacterium]
MHAPKWMALGLLLLAACPDVGAASKLKIGDMATVKADKTPVRKGRTPVAYLSKGKRIKVLHIQGGFALVRVKVSGKLQDGHVSVAALEAPTRKEVETVVAMYRVDDEVVAARQCALMMGKKELGKVIKDTRLTVKKVKGDWLGVYATIDGKRTWGWLRTKDVTYAPVRAYTGEKADAKK